MLRQLQPGISCHGTVIFIAQIDKAADPCRVSCLGLLLSSDPACHHNAVLIKIIFPVIDGFDCVGTVICPFCLAVGLKVKPFGGIGGRAACFGNVAIFGLVLFIVIQTLPAGFCIALVLAAQIVDIIPVKKPARTHPAVAVKGIFIRSNGFPAITLKLSLRIRIVPARRL